ncbi:6-hydroxymethylpterin diphosphokinase MptE-like protein [Shewanella baltica]|uniref:motility associated factor glycosyltransferase family protein n=1 Tax=Shewanella baltica TaxID=62322 RepID=UPI003CFF4C2C
MQLQTNILNHFAISRFNEYYLPSINRRTFESIDSKTIYDKNFKNGFSNKDNLNIIIGMDSGLLANYVLEADIPEGSKFVFIELSSVLPLLVIDIPSNLQKKLIITDELGIDELFSQNDIKLYFTKGQYHLFSSLSVASRHIDDYNTLFNSVESKLQKESFKNQIDSTQKLFIHAQLDNIADNHTQAKILRSTFNGKTCIIIAGGPSLDKSIDWIKENQHNLYIICASRIAGKLVSLCIKPDIVVSVDPQEISFNVSRGMFDLSDNTLLVHSYHVCPKILSQWRGKCLYMGQRLPWDDKNDKDNIATIGPTVTNSSVRLAIEMGFSRVLLSGVDFCYSKSGYSHASGTPEASLGPCLGHNTVWVETYEGYPAETLLQLRHAMESLEQEAKAYPEVAIINLSSSAAKVQGTICTEPNDIHLDILGGKSINNISFKNSKDDLLNVATECIKAKNDIEIIFTLVKKAKNLSKKLSLNSKLSAKKIDEINKIENLINKKHSKIASLAKFYGYLEFSSFLTTKDTETWTQSHINDMTIKYYNAFSYICEVLKILIGNAYNKIQFRLSEMENTPLTELAVRWKKENQPGRSLIWQKMHKDHNLTTEEIDLLLEINLLFKKNTTQLKQIYTGELNSHSAMNLVYNKIIRLNQSQNHYGLSLTVNNLQSFITKNTEANRLYHLALAFQLSLEQQPQQALDALLALPEELCTEMELKHIILLALKLSKLELATATLVKILAHSDEYMPQYAHILKLQGKIQESVNVYLDYLEKYPSDTQTWIKLGLFMFEINQVEASHTAFSNAINADPDNQVAREYLAELTRLMNTPQ